jgi:hypothetical protein
MSRWRGMILLRWRRKMERSSIPTLVSVKASTRGSFPWRERRTPRCSGPRKIIWLWPIVTHGSCRVPIRHWRARRQKRGAWKRLSIMKLMRRWCVVEGLWRRTTTCMVTKVAPPTKITPSTKVAPSSASLALHGSTTTTTRPLFSRRSWKMLPLSWRRVHFRSFKK